jgi:7,8-dihydropterin-6-yl-methyl-4-(beta-D-ribofuranosyl)aminobenzene 5'-phosphate synthase
MAGPAGSLRWARVTVLVENTTLFIDGLLAEYGFAAAVEAETEDGDRFLVLYDTGQTGKPLLHNMDVLGYRPGDFDYLVLSHRHVDHTGGVKAFLEARKKPIPVIAHPGLFEPSVAVVNGVLYEIGFPLTPEKLSSLGGRLVATARPLQLFPGLVFSGEVPSNWGPRHTGLVYKPAPGGLEEDMMSDDAFLALKLGDRVYALTGCGHAGPENIANYAKEITGAQKLGGIIGGLHLLGAKPERLREVAEFLAKENPDLIAAMHCSGPFIQPLLREKLPNAYRLAGTGSRITLRPQSG